MGIDLTHRSDLDWMSTSKHRYRENSSEPEETVFWNVDTQIDFMKPDGKLPVGENQEGAEEIEQNLEYLTSLARDRNYTVVNTADWHNQDSEELSEYPDFVNTFPEHCIAGSKGAEYVEATKPEDPVVFDWREDYSIEKMLQKPADEIVVYKDRFNIFEGSPHTESIVDQLSPDKAVVYGVAADKCVDQAVNGLRDRDVDVYVVEDAVKGIDPLEAENSKNSWRERGVETILSTEVEDYLERS